MRDHIQLTARAQKQNAEGPREIKSKHKTKRP